MRRGYDPRADPRALVLQTLAYELPQDWCAGVGHCARGRPLGDVWVERRRRWGEPGTGPDRKPPRPSPCRRWEAVVAGRAEAEPSTPGASGGESQPVERRDETARAEPAKAPGLLTPPPDWRGICAFQGLPGQRTTVLQLRDLKDAEVEATLADPACQAQVTTDVVGGVGGRTRVRGPGTMARVGMWPIRTRGSWCWAERMCCAACRPCPASCPASLPRSSLPRHALAAAERGIGVALGTGVGFGEAARGDQVPGHAAKACR